MLKKNQYMSIIFLIFLENDAWHFIQTVSSAHSMNEMSSSVFLGKVKEKIFKSVIANT